MRILDMYGVEGYRGKRYKANRRSQQEEAAGGG
jgi:hypothetical protein